MSGVPSGDFDLRLMNPEVAELAARYTVIPITISKHPDAGLLIRVGSFDWVGVNGHRKKQARWKPFQKRFPTEQELFTWMTANPDAWAVVTGEISGVIVLDFDGPRGKELMERWGITPHMQTGSGSFHAYFQHPGFRIKTLNSKQSRKLYGERWPGLDVKGDGGYAIAHGRNKDGPYQAQRALEPDPWETVPAELRAFLWSQSPDNR